MAEQVKYADIPGGYLALVDKFEPLRKHLTGRNFHPELRRSVVKAEIELLKGLAAAEAGEVTHGTIQG